MASQTFYERDDPTFYSKPDDSTCEDYPQKPRVVERNGSIRYKEGEGRSLDNTGDFIEKIRIIHIRDFFDIGHYPDE